MRPCGVVEGELLVDEGTSPSAFTVTAWREARGDRESLQSGSWVQGEIESGGQFHINHLRPGSYTIAVSMNRNDSDATFIAGVKVTTGSCSDARLRPIDLRHRTRQILIETHDEVGRPVNATAYAILDDGGWLRVGATNRPILLPIDRPISTILIDPQGNYFPESLGPVEGTREVVLDRGIEVTLEWAGEDLLPSQPYSLMARLEPTAAQKPVIGGRRAESYVRDSWSPSRGGFSSLDKRAVLRVREPGRYTLSWMLRFNEGFTHDERIASDPESIDVVAGRVEVHRVSVPSSALRDARERARRVVERFQSQIKR
jgi:hypothetical protein